MRNVGLVGSLVVLAAASYACDGPGFNIQGSLQASMSDATHGSPPIGFRFDHQARVAASLQPGVTSGSTGSCRIGPDARSLHLYAVGSGATELRDLTIVLNSWAQDDCSDCQHGQIQALVGQSTFAGVENRGGGASPCTFTADQNGAHGMVLTAHCTGLTAAGDARTLSFDGTVTLDRCDGPALPTTH